MGLYYFIRAFVFLLLRVDIKLQVSEKTKI